MALASSDLANRPTFYLGCGTSQSCHFAAQRRNPCDASWSVTRADSIPRLVSGILHSVQNDKCSNYSWPIQFNRDLIRNILRFPIGWDPGVINFVVMDLKMLIGSLRRTTSAMLSAGPRYA